MGGLYEVTGASAKKYYVLAGQMIAMRDSSGLKYFLQDQLSSFSAVLNDSGTLITQQRYLPFGQVRTDRSTISTSITDFGYTGQRNIAAIGLMDYKARAYDPALGRFIQPDTIIPKIENPQSWNRYSYVSNDPILYNDPSGHDQWWCDENPNCAEKAKATKKSQPSKVANEDGICFDDGKYRYCSGTWKSNWENIKWSLFEAPPYDWKYFGEDLASVLKPLNDIKDFAESAKDYWKGSKIKGSGDVGFGVDAAIQLLKDSGRNDLTMDQRLERAGIKGVEGLSIAEISVFAADNASTAVLDPSLALSAETGQLWIPPVAVGGTWVLTYLLVDAGLSTLADNKLDPRIMPGGK
jgi:RHS repeat-associated protein